jgi:hypothetical protein
LIVIMRFCHLLPALSAATALVLTPTLVFAQDAASATEGSKCKLITVKRGESAELVPEESFEKEQAAQFPYLFDDSHLREDFRVEDDRKKGCLVAFGFPNLASAGGAGAGAAAAASVPGGVATVGAGIGAGVGAVAAGTVIAVSVAAVAAGVAVGVVTGGGTSGQSSSATNTTLGDD